MRRTHVVPMRVTLADPVFAAADAAVTAYILAQTRLRFGSMSNPKDLVKDYMIERAASLRLTHEQTYAQIRHDVLSQLGRLAAQPRTPR